MYIKHTATADPDSPVATTALIHEEYTRTDDGELERVAFDPDTGRARVKRAIGEQLVEHYDAIEEVSE